MNRNFGKLTDGKITYAPKTLWDGDTCYCNPTAEQYASQGWLPIHDEKPAEKVGVYYIPDGWEYRPTPTAHIGIYRTYREEPIVAPPVVYVVEEIIYNLIAVGKLQAVKAVVGDYWELLTMRERIDATNEMWGEVFPNVRDALIEAGVFENEYEIYAILDKCREGYEGEEVR